MTSNMASSYPRFQALGLRVKSEGSAGAQRKAGGGAPRVNAILPARLKNLLGPAGYG